MADKIKRGVEVTRTDNGENWYCERDRQDGTILLRDTPNESPQAIYFDTVLSNITTARKFATPIKNKPKQLTTAEADEKKKLNDFFDRIGLKVPGVCDECGQPLKAFNKFGKRAVSAHIFPKSNFKSIATDENNIFFLGADLLGGCSCHDEWDKLGANHRKTMKVYEIALWALEHFTREKFNNRELIQAYTYLGIEWQ